MINIALCDDDKYLLSELENILLGIAKNKNLKINVETYSDGFDLEKDINKGEQFDILFLDIEMTQDGIVTARKIRKKGIESLIIYMSNYEQYLKELFEVDTFRFLEKPLKKQKVEKYLLEAVQQLEDNNKYFSYQYNRQMRRVRIKDIIYFESDRRKILLHKKNGDVVEFYGKLDDVETSLNRNEEKFLRTHKSFLINSIYILGWRNTKLELEGEIYVPISEEQQKIVRKKYSNITRGDILSE